MEEPVDYTEEGEDQPPAPKKKRGASRIYHGIMTCIFAVLLLISVISLGTFGAKHAEVSETSGGSRHSCILFGKGSIEGGDSELSVPGSCAFVLWGQVSVAIVFLVWLVFSVVLTVIGPKIVSLLRILDLVMALLSGLLSFSVSVTLHAGLSATCKAYSTADGCSSAKIGTVGFYNEVNTAKSTSWIVSITFILLSLWYSLAMVIFCIRCSRRRKMSRDYGFLEGEEGEDEDTPKAI